MRGEGGRAERRSRVRALLVVAVVIGASVYPLTWTEGRDSFPLSSYPMFSAVRSDAAVHLVLALGDGPDGSEPLPTEATGHRHLTQAVRALASAVEQGGDHPKRLCDEIAAWTREHRRTIERVRIVTAGFDGLAFLRDGERTPDVLVEHTSCIPAS